MQKGWGAIKNEPKKKTKLYCECIFLDTRKKTNKFVNNMTNKKCFMGKILTNKKMKNKIH